MDWAADVLCEPRFCAWGSFWKIECSSWGAGHRPLTLNVLSAPVFSYWKAGAAVVPSACTMGLSARVVSRRTPFLSDHISSFVHGLNLFSDRF